MNNDYPNHGVLNENHRGSAAFTRERLRGRALFHAESPAPAAGMPTGPEAETGTEMDSVGPTLNEPVAGLPPSS